MKMENGNKKFVTENVYKGDWNENQKCMEGFGLYKFQDGSEYHGYFHNGKIHGCGVWQFGLPYNTNVVTTYKDGKLEKLHKIIYADKMQFKNLKSHTIDFEDWKYCTKNDRRYSEEIFRGLQPVGAQPYAEHSFLDLKPSQYDTKDAIFLKASGFKINRNPTLTTSTFVPCKKELEWIKDNCPRGLKQGEYQMPKVAVARKILKENIEAANKKPNKVIKKINLCSSDKKGNRYFERLCEFEKNDAEIISITSNINTINKQPKCVSYENSGATLQNGISLQISTSSSLISSSLMDENFKHQIDK